MAIADVRIQSVRGIRRELTLALDGSSLVLRGDNGTGKSSIVAGLLWALRGEQEPSPRAKAGSEEAYFANVVDGPSSSQVSITIKGKGRIVVKPGHFEADDAGKALRAGCERSSPFLLRKHLLKFLEDRPVDRFKYLESFLDLGQADQIRESLLARSREHESAAQDHQRTRDAHLRSVLAALPHELVPKTVTWSTTVGALQAWAKQLDVAPSGKSWDDLLGLADKLGNLLQGESLARRRLLFQAALDAWTKVTQATPPEDPTPLLAKLDDLVASATDASISSLLEQARRHFDEHPDREACPVCEQRIDVEDVKHGLTRRIDGLRELSAVRARIAEASTSWRSYFSLVSAAVNAHRRAKGPETLADAPTLPAHGERDAQRFDPASWVRELVQLGVGQLLDWAKRTSQKATRELKADLDGLPAEENTDAIRRLVEAIRQADKVRLAVEVAEASASDATVRAERLKAVAEAIRTARQDVARELLDEIKALVTEFYERIHPADGEDEVTGAPAIEVQRRASGTAHVRGKFDKKEVEDPRWVYSDGHLDTVGICVFLALRRFRADRDKTADHKLMILDDIVLSIDLSHGRRFLDLLRERFDDHQVLIFTHNGLFFDWCAQRLPKFKRKAIARWTLETGPQLGEYLSALEHIEKQIETATSPKLLAQAVMNLMDEWLAQARFEYSLSIPAKRGEEYTLTEIWQPFQKRMKEMEKALKAPIGRLTPLLSELADLPQMRNRLAAHDNDFAKDFPLATVRDFAKRVLELVRLLYCTECTTFAIPMPNHEAPETFRCKCERIRLVRPARHAAIDSDAAKSGALDRKRNT
jgi:recombinational DNA repair ATPase RecF